MSTGNMNDKIVVVTGGAQGIGRAIVESFTQAGANVVIADINEEAAKKTAADVSEKSGRDVIGVRTDVSDLDSVQAMAAQAERQFGRVDVLVNNAGFDIFGLFLKSTPDLWQKIIAINYEGVLNTCYAILPMMIAQKSGAIVNIASDAGRSGSMGEAVYAGCKAGIIAFSKTIAREHARDNIRVNVVAPGITNTAMFRAVYENELGGKIMDAIARSIPLGRRPGEPEEIAPAVRFLASDEASYITGQVLSVSGGLSMVD